MEIQKLLEQVKRGETTVEEAARLLEAPVYEDLGYAKLDHHRKLRSGFGEVVYCAGKTPQQVAGIFSGFARTGGNVLGTRATGEHARAVRDMLPDCVWDRVSSTVSWLPNPVPPTGAVAVCSGGTSDLPVAEEAAVTAEFFGCRVLRIHDVGIAGIHRLFDQLETLKGCNCIIAAAGMEGALAGVVAGLVDMPVIALPTSVGYGASFGGLSALLTMLNSCAEGVGVVNIDNGFGAGYLAAQINRLAVKGGNTR